MYPCGKGITCAGLLGIIFEEIGLGLPPVQELRDLWTHGFVKEPPMQYRETVPPHGVILLKVRT